jgi:uncharacterized FlaG/YvyC family protein
LRCHKAANIEEVSGSSITLTGRQSTLSDLTSNPSDITTSNIIDDGNNDAANINPKKGSPPKGSTKAAAEKINAIVKESDTTAAIQYHYTLDKMVLECMQQKHDQAKEEKRVAEEKKNEKHRAANEKFYNMAEKYLSSRSLNVDDMKCLILCVKSGFDLPLNLRRLSGVAV